MPRPRKSNAATVMTHASPQSSTKFDPTRLLEELSERIRSVRLEALPDVVQALDQATAPRGAASSATQVVEALAKKVTELTVVGSKLDAIQRAVVMHALAECKGNISAAARLLGMERKALERKVARYRRNGVGGDD